MILEEDGYRKVWEIGGGHIGLRDDLVGLKERKKKKKNVKTDTKWDATFTDASSKKTSQKKTWPSHALQFEFSPNNQPLPRQASKASKSDKGQAGLGSVPSGMSLKRNKQKKNNT